MTVPIVFAHRGFSGEAPENTLVAFSKALEVGATGIELDVQLSKDGQIMVIHDEKVDRTTDGHGLVVQYTKDELKELDAGSWFSKEYRGLQIPTLKEVLELIAGSEILLNIEIKTGIVDYPGLEEKVLDLIHEYDYQHQTIYSSFNHYSLKKVKDLEPTSQIGVLYLSGLYQPWKYAQELEAEALHPIFYNIRQDFIQAAHMEGLLVRPFTIDDPSQMQQMIQLGVDGIFTNYPDRCIKLLDSME